MSKFDRILVLSDIDGTFLDDAKKIPPSNLAAIEYLIANGGHFTFATGRTRTILNILMPEAPRIPDFPCILANGTQIYDYTSGEFVREDCIDPSLCTDIVGFAATRFPDTARLITVRDTTYTDCRNDAMRSILEWENVIVKEPSEITGGINKLVFKGTPEQLAVIRGYAESVSGGRLTLSKSADILFEVLPHGADKAAAVAHVRDIFRDRYGVSPIICAAGDYENDAEMLKAADIAAAPSNAIPSVKASASIHTCSNNDGCIAGLVNRLDFLF